MTDITRRTASKMALAGLVTAQSSSTFSQQASRPGIQADLNTLIAVAVGPEQNTTIDDPGSSLANVRAYIAGLVTGLKNNQIVLGSQYKILYRERPLERLDEAATFQAAGAINPIIFCMSTSVVNAAKSYTEVSQTPVVAIVSDPKREQIHRRTNICGISGRRSQTARECLENFLATVPTLEEIYVLHKDKYNPSEDALKRIVKAASEAGVRITRTDIASSADIDKAAATWTARTKSQKATKGVLALPADILLGEAKKIIELAQAKYLPTFFPITDWVKGAMPSAIGGYGASQNKCGELMAKAVAYIWKNSNRIPDPRWEVASTIEWVTSPAAAEYLGITLPDDVPTLS